MKQSKVQKGVLMRIEVAESVWSALNDMICEFRKTEITLPDMAVESITECKMLINHYKILTANPHKSSHSEDLQVILSSILTELRRLEDLLVINAFNNLEEHYAVDCSFRLGQIWAKKPVIPNKKVALTISENVMSK